MYHKKARQLENGLWHYTNSHGDSVYPIGNCSSFKSCPVCSGHGFVNESVCVCDCGVIKNETPCPGHKTEEEACEHYRQYLLDKVHVTTCLQAVPCKICGVDTKQLMSCDESYYSLCAEHCNREGLASILEVYESWGS